MATTRRTVGSVLNKVIERVNSNIRRLRILEQESSVVKTRLNAVEQEMTANRNQGHAAIEEMNTKLAQMDEKFLEMETTMRKMVDQLKKVTTTTKIKELEQLIDIYNPIKSQFVTREEVERLLDDRLDTQI